MPELRPAAVTSPLPALTVTRADFGTVIVRLVRPLELPSTLTSTALPLTVTGVQQLMQRLSERSGVYVHAHKLRHTFATRAVDIGTPIFHLQQFLGHQSIEMVRRYYTADQRAALQSYARLVASSPL